MLWKFGCMIEVWAANTRPTQSSTHLDWIRIRMFCVYFTWLRCVYVCCAWLVLGMTRAPPRNNDIRSSPLPSSTNNKHSRNIAFDRWILNNSKIYTMNIQFNDIGRMAKAVDFSQHAHTMCVRAPDAKWILWHNDIFGYNHILCVSYRLTKSYHIKLLFITSIL